MAVETNFYVDGWGWNGSYAEVGGDGSEPGWGWVEMHINSVETCGGYV